MVLYLKLIVAHVLVLKIMKIMSFEMHEKLVRCNAQSQCQSSTTAKIVNAELLRSICSVQSFFVYSMCNVKISYKSSLLVRIQARIDNYRLSKRTWLDI